MKTRLTALILIAALVPAACAGQVAPYDEALERDLGMLIQLEAAKKWPPAEEVSQ